MLRGESRSRPRTVPRGRGFSLSTRNQEETIEKEIIRGDNHITKALDEAGVPLSGVVRAGDLIYVSGLPPFDPATGGIIIDDIEKQTDCVLNNVKIAVESAGGTMETMAEHPLSTAGLGP